MVSAPVGFHCPACTHAGAQRSQTIRVADQRSTPVVTYALMAVNVLVYFYGLSYSRTNSSFFRHDPFTEDFGMVSACVSHGQPWRLVSGAFLHGSTTHLLMNMWALYVLGSLLEKILGRGRFGALYAVSLCGGGLGVVVADLIGDPSITVGASGAVYGLMGALVVIQKSQGIDLRRSGLGLVLGINLVFTFLVPGISIGGHVGGFLAGLAVMAILMVGRPVRSQPPRERVARVGAVAASGVVMLVVAVALSSDLATPLGELCRL